MNVLIKSYALSKQTFYDSNINSLMMLLSIIFLLNPFLQGDDKLYKAKLYKSTGYRLPVISGEAVGTVRIP